MSKPDKHTPLTTEELFKLLDNASGKATNFDGMDDFEKDALEGFTEHSSPEQARAMVSEINTLISKKASGIESKKTKKNKVIWFSAAASIVVLILLSVFFLNETKKDSASNIALNEVKQSPVQDLTIVSPVPVESEPVEQDLQKNAEKKPDIYQYKPAPGKSATGAKGQAEDENLGSRLEQELAMAEKPVSEKKQSTDAEITNGQLGGYVSDDQTKAKLKEEVTVSDKLEAAKPVSAVTEVKDKSLTYNTTMATNASSSVVLSKNTDAKYDNSNEKIAAEKKARAMTSPAGVSAANDADADVEQAHYNGGELAIRDFVRANKNEKSLILVGRYRIKAIVHVNGRLRVTSVVQLTKESCEQCTEVITKALNTMTGWTPATWDKKPTASTAEFVLEF